MTNRARAGVLCAALICLAVPSAPAIAAETVTTTTTTTAAPGAPAPAPGHLVLSIENVGGKPAFELLGGTMTVRGTVTPYVAGQTLAVTFYLQGQKVGEESVAVLPGADDTGIVHVTYSTRFGGLAEAAMTHAATAQQEAFSARSPGVRFVSASVGPGSKGQSVRLLQSELNALHYAVPLNGDFDEATEHALIAYRKMVGLERVSLAGKQVFELLKHGVGAFHVRYPQDGRHVEADLTRQVLAEIEPGGHVYAIYPISSGKPSTPTVIGHFNVYEKTFGENSDGMVDSNYFIRGYAIHGYHEVPTYPASHGCLRVWIPSAPAIYGWVRLGTPVDVYYENGGGSTHPRGNAGP
jgi:peptidoglycan hydrolase-like protein with peptidoglycan-binding domain